MSNSYKPLEGVKVVELATVMAGPSCGRYLADWGAEVIKIETEKGDSYRNYPPTMGIPSTQDCTPLFDCVNAGKRGISINIKTPEGMEAMHRLLATADVFLTNNRPKALAKNGLDYDSLKDKYPGLIMAQVSAFGLKGPQADAPGQDTIAFWVSTGFTADMMVKTDNSYPVYGSSGTGDFITGLGLAFAIVCALYKKKETGLGDYVVNSLYGSGLWCNSNYNIGCMPRYSWTMPKRRDNSSPGSSPFQCADGEWIMSTIMDVDNQWPKFANAIGRPDWICEEYGTLKAQRKDEVRAYLMAECEKIFLTKTSAEWDKILSDYDVIHDILAHYGDFEHREQARVNDYAFDYTYPNGHETVLIRPPMTSEKMGVPEFTPGPMKGEHTEEILVELGFSPEEIAKMLETHAAYQIDKSLYNK
ncbi:MAG: CoA transferase [Oscillospiraceae bacterium]|nr:CoA transferase [Oscillospiraceae bacterium]